MKLNKVMVVTTLWWLWSCQSLSFALFQRCCLAKATSTRCWEAPHSNPGWCDPGLSVTLHVQKAVYSAVNILGMLWYCVKVSQEYLFWHYQWQWRELPHDYQKPNSYISIIPLSTDPAVMLQLTLHNFPISEWLVARSWRGNSSFVVPE